MKVTRVPCVKRLFLLSILPLFLLSVLCVNVVEVSAVEYPAIYMEPARISDATLALGTNFTVSIKTDYNGTDIRNWQFTLAYNTSVIHGGIRGTDMWTGDNATSTFNLTKKPVVPDSGVVYVNETLMTRETEGNDTWNGDGVTRTFDTTGKPVVPDSEVVYVNETLMTGKTEGNDTWTGDGVTKTFNTTKKPLFDYPGESVYVDGAAAVPNIDYTVDYAEGIIEFKDAEIPANGSKVEAEYDYGHYTVDYSEGKIEFYSLVTPADGAEIKATYQYVQYTVNYAEGRITFTTAPSEGAKVEVAYLYGGVTNGDLITTAKDPSATFSAGTFDNTAGILSLTYAHFLVVVPGQPYPVTSGPGTLANVVFTVVGIGASNLTLVKPVLGGAENVETYVIIDETMPDQIGHGYFSNLPSVYVDPATTVAPDLTPGTNYTVSIYTDYNGSDVWGYEFTLTYNPLVLQGIEVTNGDLITTAKDPSATFSAGTFNNEAGNLSLTAANFSDTETPLPVTSGPGTLADVTFTVVGTGTSNITLGPETKLVGVSEEGAGVRYNIVDSSMPHQIRNGFFDNTVHDVAVTDVTASSYTVKIGEPVSINVTVTNEGDFSETFNVTVYFDSTAIGTQKVTDLAARNEANLIFTWNTTGVTRGNYTISATATSVPSEIDTVDNSFTDGTVKVEEAPSEGIPFQLIVAAAGAAGIVIVAIVLYYLKIRKPTPT